jgi:transcription elongation GreA/GreB family factor
VNKQRLVAAIIEQLSAEMALIATAAKSAHEEATHDGDRNENQFDTPGLETSVLAEGQVKVAAELREAVDAYRALELNPFDPKQGITLGALVDTEARGERTLYFMGPKAGGLSVQIDGKTALVITPHSPVGHRMIGRRPGDTITIGTGPKGRPMRIVAAN